MKKQQKNIQTSSTKYMPPMAPEKLTNRGDQLNYLFIHYWDNFNFLDTTKILNPEYGEQAFVDYVSLFSVISKEDLDKGISDFLDQAKMEQRGFDFFRSKFDSYLYDPNSPFHNEDYYQSVLSYFLTSDKITQDDKIRYKVISELIKKNAIGTIATNFKFKTEDKAENALKDIQSPLLMVMFYEPGCPNCKEVIEILKDQQTINKLIADGKFKILAIYPDGNLDIWSEYADKVPSNWINGVDENQIILNQGLYDLKASPTIYLLDKDKKVILKDTDLKGIDDYFSSLGL